MATAIVVAHLCGILLLGSSPAGALLSNLAQLASSLLAAASCFIAAHRSRRFARQFWLLSGSSFLLWAAGQCFWIYYENWLHTRIPQSSPAYMLAFFAFAPLAMVLFLNDQAEPEGTDWLQTMDFIQVGMVLLSAYLFLFQVPTFWQTREEMSRTLMVVFDARNLLLTAAFALCAWRARAPALRMLYGRMAAVLVLFTGGVMAACYMFVTYKIPTGSVWDLAWTVPFALAAVNAAHWKDLPTSEMARARELSRAALVAINALPLTLPLLVLLLASRIAQEQLAIAAAAVVASFACYGLRAVVVQHRRQHVVEQLERTLDMLEKAEQKFRLLFASNPEPMWVYDPRTLRFLEVNNAAIDKYGYSREEFLRLKVTDIRPVEDVPQFLDAVQVRRSRNSGPYFGHWRHRHQDGRVLNVEVTAQGLEFAGRRAVLVVVKDVSERMQLGEQLRQAQKMEAVGRLAGGVAHDFNNVLTVITGYTSILLESLDPDSPQALDLRQISKSADRAAALTRQLLAFSRRQVLQPRVVNLNSLVLNAEKMLERLIGEDIEIHLSLETRLGSVSADPGQLEQVIMNLAVNARDAMPDGGNLTFETRDVEVETARSLGHFRIAPGSYVMLAVRDTGCGMDQETVGRIFEPFFTTKEKGKGTGLGLSTVYGIVKQSGGYVWVESAPEEGSTFTIYLPRVEAPADEEGDEPLSGAKRGGETVLLVEDDAVLRELARRILAGSGYHVLPAGGVVEAERFCRQHAGNLDLLLTDVVMPGMSGRDLARRLAVTRPRMCVLYMSGYTDDVIVHRGVLEPGTHFLQKPFTPRALLHKVREVLDGCVEPEPEVADPCPA